MGGYKPPAVKSTLIVISETHQLLVQLCICFRQEHNGDFVRDMIARYCPVTVKIFLAFSRSGHVENVYNFST